jgi:hypothetical protein
MINNKQYFVYDRILGEDVIMMLQWENMVVLY